MTDVLVVIIVGEVYVERVGIELNLRFGIVGGLPCVLCGHLLGHPKHLRHEILRHSARMLRIHGRQRHGPVVSIAAQGADHLLLGHNLQHGLQVVEEPVLGGDRSRTAALLVLVVVHQQQAIGVVRHVLQIKAVVAHRRVDIQFQVALLEVLIERGEQCHVSRLCLVGYLLEVQRDSTIAGARGEELVDLLYKVGTGCGVGKKVTDGGLKYTLDRIVVVDQRKNLRVLVRRRNGACNPALVIHGKHSGRVHHGEGAIVHAIGGQRAVRRDHMEPLREEQIDLVDVLLQRGVAGRIVLHVVRRAQAFARVQDHLGGLQVGSAMQGAIQLLARFDGLDLQGADVPLGRRQQQLRQRRHLQQADHKQNPDDDAEQREAIEDSP